MSVNHAAIAAFPIPGTSDKSLIRNCLTSRMPYCLADADLPTDLIAVDPSTGAAIVDILYLGRVFHYDPTDTTTANDGTSCLVSNEGRRYKLAQGTDVFAYAVLDNTHTAPPGSPAQGDAYLVAAAATGAWAGKDNQVAVYTRRGWEFINFGIGRLIYVESVESYYHKTSLGVWTLGFGAQTLGAGSVPITSVIGANASFVIKIENQTTNTPPGSPTAPTAYIIGPSPTGAWAGNAGKLAICLVNGAFTIITPVDGDQVYDKALKVPYAYSSAASAWISGGGSWVGFQTSGLTASGSTTAPSGTTPYTYSSGTAPTTSTRRLIDTVTLTRSAKRTGAILRFHYSADVVFSGSPSAVGNFVVALFRDAAANAVDWSIVHLADWAFGLAGATLNAHLDHWFEVAAPDTSSHTYTIAITSKWAAGPQIADPSALTRRIFEVEESA